MGRTYGSLELFPFYMALFRATKHAERGSKQRPVLQSLTSRNTSRGERKSAIMKYIQRESAQSKTRPGNQQLIQAINLNVSSCNIKSLSLTLDIYLAGGDVENHPCKSFFKNRPFLFYFKKCLVRLTLYFHW